MGKNANFVSHKKSKQKNQDGTPQLPLASALVEGEIAINFAENVETLSIKNESGDVVTFSSDNYYSEKKLGSAFTGANSAVTVTDVIEENEEIIAAALTDLDERKLDTSAYTPSVELWESGTGLNSVVLKGSSGTASGDYSVAEGNATSATSEASHTEGSYTIASGESSHAEGLSTKAIGMRSHSEGNQTTAAGDYSHAEGYSTTSVGVKSHAEGSSTVSVGEASHAEGSYTNASGNYSHAEGSSTVASGGSSHAEGTMTIAVGYASHAEGQGTQATASYSHAEGQNTSATSMYSHAEGESTLASGQYSHAEGWKTVASDYYSHAEGKQTSATSSSHSEGSSTLASGQYSHAEGEMTSATTNGAHAEGGSSVASGGYSHAEGHQAIASGNSSHAEGYYTTANGDYSHTEGRFTTANGIYSHTEGQYTIANNDSEHASGQWNVSNSATTTFGDSGNTLFSVGNGTSEYVDGQLVTTRHNAFEIRQNGDIYIVSGNSDIKLQDYIGGGGGSITVDQVLDDTTSASTNPVSSKAVYDAVTDNELVWTNAYVALSGTVSAHTADTSIHVTSADKEKLHTHSNKSVLDSITGNVGTMAYENTSSYSSATQVSTALQGKSNSNHNQGANTITAMTGYQTASTVSAISTSDTLNQAMAKLEARFDGIRLLKISQTDYDNLQTKDPNTLYVITD